MTPKHQNRLPSLVCLVAKYWEPGTVKTRLGADVGMPVSAALHQRFVKHLTKRLGAGLPGHSDTPPPQVQQASCQNNESAAVKQIWAISPPDAVAKVQGEVPGWEIGPQGDGDLGERLQRLFQDHLACRSQDPVEQSRMLVIGGDCPDLPAATIAEALDQLRTVDAVLGPASDGGYYLLGLKGPWQDWMKRLFQEVPWSQPEVAEVTRDRLKAAGRRWHELPCRDDVDTLADLCRLVERLQANEVESLADGDPSSERELLNEIWDCLPVALRSLPALHKLAGC
ncbi:hypothetical protein FF011L_46630 [Roseimaritima multifibrata]|uniref:2-phospho-L-lactate guanylyltransferase n=1 Tax=Roseimaritima multifibrata TaxID=1930274 RepID=A0A517MLV0_9BACT|nr:TIGR04282 family arsenosugar biosynthesis glycosyltransferase [Roseimaritima multifibrata]QDS95862.1 hypothetical protein FF011L_46630 [Roseimaritima multifibrata]